MSAPPPASPPVSPPGAPSEAGPDAISGAVTAGELARFQGACESHVDFVWRFAKACGVEPSRLDAVVHKVFGVVRGRLISLDEPSELRISIAGITRQVVRGYLHPLGAPLEPFAQADEHGALDLDRIDAIETKTASELVDIILRAMSEAEREVFVLSELEGFSLTETALALHVSEGTLRVRLDDARRIFNDVSAHLRALRFWMTRPAAPPP